MIVTITDVLVGKVRGQVTVCSDLGRSITLTMTEAEARWFVDRVDKKVQVMFTDVQETPKPTK